MGWDIFSLQDFFLSISRTGTFTQAAAVLFPVLGLGLFFVVLYLYLFCFLVVCRFGHSESAQYGPYTSLFCATNDGGQSA